MVIRINKDKLVAFLYAISYFLELYILPGLNLNAGYFPLMLISLLYLVLTMKKPVKLHDSSYLQPIVITMSIYVLCNQLVNSYATIYNTSKTNLASIISMFLFLIICIFTFKTNEEIRKYYIKYMEDIAIVSAAIVMLQCMLYYVFGSSVSHDRSFLFPFPNLMTKGVQEYIQVSKMVSNGIFRPSAFFLEPAHLSQFCSIGLACLLLENKRLLNKKAIFVSVGIILSTSGIGIACVFALWGVSLFINGDGFTRETLLRIFSGIMLAAAVFALAFTVSYSFRSAVIRVFVASNGYNSGFEGRLWSRSFLKNLSGMDSLFGMGYKNIPVYGTDKTQYYMTGIIEMLYCQGIAGMAIFGILYIFMFLRAKRYGDRLPMIILILFVPFFIGTSCLNALTLSKYIPFLYFAMKRKDMTE